MTSHRKQVERRPVYAALILALVSAAVILTFRATAPNAAPIFNATQAQADLAQAPLAPAPSLIPLPGAGSIGKPASPVTAAAKTTSSPAQPTPFTSTYQSLVSARSPAPAGVTTPAAVSSPGAVAARNPSSRGTQPPKLPKEADPTPVTRHTERPSAHPTTHPTEPGGTRTGRGGDGNGDANGAGNKVPWWWNLVPHRPTAPTFPRYPVGTHTSNFPTAGTTHTHDPSTGVGWRRTGR